MAEYAFFSTLATVLTVGVLYLASAFGGQMFQAEAASVSEPVVDYPAFVAPLSEPVGPGVPNPEYDGSAS